MIGLTESVAIGMSAQRAADLRQLNEQIELTAAHLAGLRQQRDELMASADDPMFDNGKDYDDAVAVDPIVELRQVNHTLRDYLERFEAEQRRIDEEFDQRMAYDETEPQREFSDVY